MDALHALADRMRMLQGPFWDRMGIGASVLCLLHCLSIPLLLLTGGALSTVLDAVHLWTVILLVPVVGIAGFWGLRLHGNRSVLILLGAGLLAAAGALLLEPALGTPGKVLLSVAGGALLIAGHWRNLYLGTNTSCATASK